MNKRRFSSIFNIGAGGAMGALAASATALGIYIALLPNNEWGNYVPATTKNLQDRQLKFDNAKTYVFKNEEDCAEKTSKTELCKNGYDNATSISNSWAMRPNYKNLDECQTLHSECKTASKDFIVRTGKHHKSVPETRFEPTMIAWQALASNPDIVVPLYSGRMAGVAVRQDGKEFNLAPN